MEGQVGKKRSKVDWWILVLPESALSKVKFSGSPPINTPVFSPITVLPLEADLLPAEAGSMCNINNREVRNAMP